MGKRYSDLKRENEELRQALKAKFVKHSIRTGDLVVFLADQNPSPGQRGTRYQKSTLGMSFGTGYAAMENLRRMLVDLAGGPVGVLASSQEEINCWILNRDERARLRATLDAVDRGVEKPQYAPLQNPLPPIYADPSVEGSIAWATKKQGLTPCPRCGLSMEGRTHGPGCQTGDITSTWGDEALDTVFRGE